MMEDGGIMVELGMRIIIAGGIRYSKCRRDLLKVYLDSPNIVESLIIKLK